MKLEDMLRKNSGIIVSLYEASFPAKPTEPNKEWDKDWLSQEVSEIETIFTFSFDRIKELSGIDNITSCDAFFCIVKQKENTAEEQNANFLFEFKNTTSTVIVDKYLAEKTTDKNYIDSINRKIKDSAQILKKLDFDETDGKDVVGHTHVVIVYREDIKGASNMRRTTIEKPTRGAKKRAKGATRYNLFDGLENMENPKQQIINSLNQSAENVGYEKRQLTQDELKNMKNKLSNTSQRAGFQNYEMQKKRKGYVTVLNRKEFAKIFNERWNEVFKNWDWGIYKEYFEKVYFD